MQEYFKLKTEEERSSYLNAKINNFKNTIIPEHSSYLLALIPKAVELAEEFISNGDIANKTKAESTFLIFLNEHVAY